MKTLTVSNSENRTIEATVAQLVEIIRMDGLDKVEICDKHGWEYLENRMMKVGFNWDNNETTAENIERFIPLYDVYLGKETREEEFGRLAYDPL